MDDYGFASRLKDARRMRGWTQTELSRRSGVHAMALSRLERGEKKDVTGATLRKLARALGCTSDYLLGLDGPEEIPLLPQEEGGELSARPHLTLDMLRTQAQQARRQSSALLRKAMAEQRRMNAEMRAAAESVTLAPPSP